MSNALQTENGLGKVILLNGASSSGKSTIASLLQNSIPEPFWCISIDHLRDAGVLPTARIKSGEFPWSSLRKNFFDGYHRSLASYAEAGNNLIIEHIVETEEWMRELVTLFERFDVYFVGLHCSIEELERREAQRKDRPLGDAARDSQVVHKFATYDLELDSNRPPEENVSVIIFGWQQRTRPSAFQRMASKLNE